jgi:peptidoglycan/xylan/chitin deacetylase (PgdA/CDA1 family)
MKFAQRLRAHWTIWQAVEDVGIGRGEILLTFDDGPDPDVTPQLLDVLKKEDVRAAFCVCGRLVRVAPDLVRRTANEGHLVVNHGERHQPLALFSKSALQKEIGDCDMAIAVALETPGYHTEFYRPACGLLTSIVKRVLAELKKRVLPVTYFGWDTNVTRHTFRQWIAMTRRAAGRDQGGIFVLHDRRLRFSIESNYDPTDRESSAFRGWVPNATSELIGELRSDGFTFLDPNVWSRRQLLQSIDQCPFDPN